MTVIDGNAERQRRAAVGECGGPISWEIVDDMSAETLRAAWERDMVRNPFMAPAYTRVMLESAPTQALRPVIAVGRAADGSPRGVWPLAIDTTGKLRFLHHILYDQLTAIAADDLPAEHFAQGLIAAIRAASPRRVIFSDVAPWGTTVRACSLAFAELGWAHREIQAVPCPLIRADSGAQLTAELRARSSLRRSTNRIRREGGLALEVLEDASAIEDWCCEFTDAHRWRWRATDTPSQYEDRETRALLERVIRAWLADGLLTRFALRVRNDRVAFAAALTAHDRLMYHHLALGPKGESLRAGWVLLYLTGLWAGDRGYRVFDLGSGREEYKMRVANDTELLWRVYATPGRLSSTFAGAVLEQRVRQSPRLERLWSRLSTRRLRGFLRRVLNGRRSPRA